MPEDPSMQDDLLSLEPKTKFDRREFITAMLGAGFALAVQPIQASTVVKTDNLGLIEGEVNIPAGDRSIPAYRAMPLSGKDFPVILVIQEIFGVHEYIRDVCRRLAKLGYFAVAPDLYVRQGDVARMADIKEILSKVVAKVPDAQVMADLDATVAWANEGGQADIKKLGITGFCWGGRIVWLYAAHNPRLKAGVAWYGRLVGEVTPETPLHPIDVANTLKAPVLGLYGGKDDGIPLATVEKMRAALKAAKSSSEIVVFPDAGHAFHTDYRPSYRKAEAKEGWEKMLTWFKKHGVSKSSAPVAAQQTMVNSDKKQNAKPAAKSKPKSSAKAKQKTKSEKTKKEAKAQKK